MSANQLTTACSEKTHEVQESDLPLSCPMHGMEVWNAHPKVYLPIEVSGEERCPYCGTRYIFRAK